MWGKGSPLIKLSTRFKKKSLYSTKQTLWISHNYVHPKFPFPVSKTTCFFLDSKFTFRTICIKRKSTEQTKSKTFFKNWVKKKKRKFSILVLRYNFHQIEMKFVSVHQWQIWWRFLNPLPPTQTNIPKVTAWEHPRSQRVRDSKFRSTNGKEQSGILLQAGMMNHYLIRAWSFWVWCWSRLQLSSRTIKICVYLQ